MARDGLERINSLLVDVMEGRIKPSAEGLADRVQEIVMWLRELWISNEKVPFSLTDKVNDRIQAYVNKCLCSPVPGVPDSSFPDAAMPADAVALTEIVLQVWETNKTEMMEKPQEDWGEFLTWEADQYKKRQGEKIAQLRVAIKQLASLCWELLVNPIMVPSGHL